LHVAYVRPVHRECLKDPIQLYVVNAVLLEDASKFREGSWDVCVDDQNAPLTGLVLCLDFSVRLGFDVDKHAELLAYFEKVSIQFLEPLELL